MLRFLSGCLTSAVALAVVAHVEPASAQLENGQGPRDIIIQLQRQRQTLQADDPRDAANQPFRDPPQIVEVMRAQRAAQFNIRILQGRLQIVPGNAHFRLTLVELPGGVQFQGRAEINPAVQELPYQLELDEEQSRLVVRHYVDQCTELCSDISKVCDLSAEQWEKLNAAAVVDATRFMRRLRVMFGGTLEDQRSRNLNPAQVQHESNTELSLGIHSPDSLFRKVLCSVVTTQQRAQICRRRAEALLNEIDRHADLSLDAQVRLLKVSYPAPGQTPELYQKLTPRQSEKILELIIADSARQEVLLQLIDLQNVTNLLAHVEPEQLVDFLTAPQVQAVMRQKAMLESRRQYYEKTRANPLLQDPRLRVGGANPFAFP